MACERSEEVAISWSRKSLWRSAHLRLCEGPQPSANLHLKHLTVLWGEGKDTLWSWEEHNLGSEFGGPKIKMGGGIEFLCSYAWDVLRESIHGVGGPLAGSLDLLWCNLWKAVSV